MVTYKEIVDLPKDQSEMRQKMKDESEIDYGNVYVDITTYKSRDDYSKEITSSIFHGCLYEVLGKSEEDLREEKPEVLSLLLEGYAAS